MAVIACKLIVEHNMLEEEPSSPPPRQVDPFSDFGSFEDLFKHAMHHYVRVAADRGGEMRVILEREPEMADIFCGVHRLRHRADGRRLDDALVGRALGLLQDTIEVFSR